MQTVAQVDHRGYIDRLTGMHAESCRYRGQRAIDTEEGHVGSMDKQTCSQMHR